MGRKAARKDAVSLCYQITFHDISELEKIVANFQFSGKTNSEDKKYSVDVAAGVFENLAEIDALIEKYSQKWDADRIGKIEMAIIRVCIFEMLKRDDVPVNVSANEAIELAKYYGDEETAAFVNGVIGGIYKNADIQRK